MNIYKLPNGSFITLDTLTIVGPGTVDYSEYRCNLQFALMEKPTTVWLAGTDLTECSPSKEQRRIRGLIRRGEQERLKIVKAWKEVHPFGQ